MSKESGFLSSIYGRNEPKPSADDRLSWLVRFRMGLDELYERVTSKNDVSADDIEQYRQAVISEIVEVSLLESHKNGEEFVDVAHRKLQATRQPEESSLFCFGAIDINDLLAKRDSLTDEQRIALMGTETYHFSTLDK